MRSPDIERSMNARGVAQDAQEAAAARLGWEQWVQVHMVRKMLILDHCDCDTTARPQVPASPVRLPSGPCVDASENGYRRGWLPNEDRGQDNPKPDVVVRNAGFKGVSER